MTALLRDAIKPNLVQTLENNPAIIHGGPFANIAHGCNSVIATRAALKLADYVVTEAGFGADLGAEKFIDIKCRQSGLQARRGGARGHRARAQVPRRRRRQGAADAKTWRRWSKGIANLERHVNNVRNHFGLPCVVAINHFARDTDGRARAAAAQARRTTGVPRGRGAPLGRGRRGAEDAGARGGAP